MDKFTVPDSQQNAILVPHTSDGTIEESEMIDITFNDIKDEKESISDSSLGFKNLQFEFSLPILKHNFSTKRKQEFLLTKQSEEKRRKLEENADLDNENSDDDEVEKVFNYMTGTYEPVIKDVKSESDEIDENPKKQSEIIPVQKQKRINRKKAVETGPVQGSSTDIIVSKPDAATAPHLGGQTLLSNGISFLIDEPLTFLDNSPYTSTNPCPSPFISLGTHIVPLSESQQPRHDDSSNHSLISVTSPSECLTHIDKTTNVTIITASKYNSILANHNSLAQVNSSGSTLKESATHVDPLPNDDDDSNHSVISVDSPPDLSCIDDSSNDAGITTPENNLILEDSTASSVVQSSGVILKELYISITPLPISNGGLSLSNGSLLEPEVDEENGNSEQYWNCKTCGFNANTKKNLISHIYNAHLKEDYEIKMKCKSCNFECNTPREMEQHELIYATSLSNKNVTLTGNQNHIISDCRDSSPTKDIQTHTNEATVVMENNDIFEVCDSDDDFPSKPKSTCLQCFFCKFATNRELNLKVHAETHRGKMYYCEDHFWSSAVSTCPKCTFENTMTHLSRNCDQHSLTKKSNKKRKLQNTDQDNNTTIEHSSALQNSIQLGDNVSLNISNEPDPNSTPNTRKGCNLDDGITKNTENLISKTVQDLDQQVSDASKESDPLTLKVSVNIATNNKEQAEQLGEDCSNVGKNTENPSSSTKVIGLGSPTLESCIANVADVEMPLLSVEAASDTESSVGNLLPNNPNVSHTISDEHVPSSTPNTGHGCNLDNYEGMTQDTENFNSKTIQDVDNQVSCSDTSIAPEIPLSQKVSVKNSINNKEEEGILGENCFNAVQNTEKLSSSTNVIGPSSPILESCVADVEMLFLSVDAASDAESSLGNVLPKSSNVSHTISNEPVPSSTPNTGHGCNLDNYEGMVQDTENLNRKTIQDVDNQVPCSDTSTASEIPLSQKVSVNQQIKTITNKEQEDGILGKNCFNVIKNTEKCSSSTNVIGPSSPTLESCVADVEMLFISVEAASDTETSLQSVSPKSPKVSHSISNEHVHSSTLNTGNGCNLDNYVSVSESPLSQEVSVINSINNKEKVEGILGQDSSNVVKNTENPSCDTKVIGPSGPSMENCVANVADVEIPLLSVEAAINKQSSLGNVSPKSPNASHSISNTKGTGPSSPSSESCVANVADVEIPLLSVEAAINKQSSLGNVSPKSPNASHSISNTKGTGPSSPSSESCVANVADVEMPLLSVEAVLNKQSSLGNVSPKGPNASHSISNTKVTGPSSPSSESCVANVADVEMPLLSVEDDLDKQSSLVNVSPKSPNVSHSISNTKVTGPSSPSSESCVANVADVEMPLLSVEAALNKQSSIGNVSPKSPNVSHSISNEDGHNSTPNTKKGCNLDDGMTNTENFISKPIQDLDNQVPCSDTSLVSESSLSQKVSITSSTHNKEQEEAILGEDCSNVAKNTENPSSTTKVTGPSSPSSESCVANVADDIETLENSVLTDTNCKKRKSSKNLESDTINLDESDSSERDSFAITFKCFDCDIGLSKKDELKTHALSCHPNSDFKCNIHESKIGFHECAKCVYELIFRTVHRTSLSIQDPFDVGWNLEVPASTANHLGGDVLQVTQYKEPRFNEIHSLNSDSDSDVCFDSVPTERRITRASVSKSKGVNERNQGTRQLNYRGDSDGGTDSDFDSDDSVIKTRPPRTKNKTGKIILDKGHTTGSLSVETDNGKSRVPCFDCSNFFTHASFMPHIGRHVGSKYQCIRHNNLKQKPSNCKKCYYERALQAVPKRMNYCKCGYRTGHTNHMNRHRNAKSNCVKWKNRVPPAGEMRCLVCSYRTNHKIFLKYHMVDHLDLTLCCKEHNSYGNYCELCLNEECLEAAKKEVISCERCKFKTVIKQLFDVHNCKGKSVQYSDKNTTRKVCVPQLVATGSGNLGTSTTQNVNLEKDDTKKFKCFDCNAYFPDMNLRFTNHICYHIGSKYQCIKHQKIKADDCQGCIYERALKDVLKSVKYCDCGYKTVLPDNLIKHKNRTAACEKWTNRPLLPRELRCLTCHYVTKHKKFLKYHMVDHLDLTLSCGKKHDKNDGSCELCLNEECLESAKKEVIICEKCNFKTLLKQIFDVHDCQGNTVQNADESTKKIISDPQHSSMENAKETPITSSIITDSKTDCPSGREDDSTVAQTLIKAKCFDCKYSSKENNNLTFKKHVRRHIGSKYQCIEHWKNKVANCLKCLYVEVLQGLQTEANTCTTCGYVTVNKLRFTTHLDDTESCSKWTNRTLKSNGIRCLRCRYVTTHRKFLKYHMVDHLDLTFSCNMHRENKDAKCNKCINEECLENAKKEVKTCDTCNFKTAIKQVFSLHNCEEENAKTALQNITPIGKNAEGAKVVTENTNGPSLGGDNAQRGKEIVNVNNAKLPTENVVDKGDITPRAQCFDCKFTCTDKVNRFLDHVCRHIGSKYQCIKHQIKPSKDCQKCHYESALKDVRDKVQLCNHCGYKTPNNSKFSKHTEGGTHSCNKWRNRSLRKGEMKCSHCEYVTTHKTFLKYHMVDHLDLTLSCKLHRDKENGMCATCLNVKSLENAKKEVKKCEKCNFKTLIKQVFNFHDCKEAENTKCKSIKDNTKEITGVSLTGIANDNSKKNSDNTEVNGDVSQSLKENDIVVKSEITLKCFDCKFFSNNDKAFEEHVCRHIGSKYQCVEHWRSNGESCPKCHYEEVLQKLQIKIKACNICGYKTLDKLGMSRHLEKFGSCSSWVNRHLEPHEIRCLQCQYVTTHKKFLKYHMVDHLDVTFSCDVHQDNKNDNCEKCIYEKCLERAKNEVQVCNKCDLKTVIKPIFDIHNCEGEMASNQLGVSSDNTEGTIHLLEENDASEDTNNSNKSNNTEGTRKELEKNDASENTNNSNNTEGTRKELEKNDASENTNNSNNTEGTRKELEKNDASENTNNSNKSNNTEGTSNVNVEINAAVKCFDCKYSSNDRLFRFRRHIACHLGSKFQCMEHTNLKYMDCLKCHYEVALDRVAKEIKRCSKCGYTNIDANRISRHTNGIDSCKKWIERKLKPGQVRCFECQYMTTHKKFLTYHMVDHLDIKFVCTDHRQNKDKECLKCIYEECLEGAKKEAIICEKCKFKTVIRKVFRLHECRETEDKAETYTCLDCNEFTSSNKDELEKHSVVHYDSEFRCDEHSLENALDNCKKCFYQNIIESVKKSIIVCEFCTFKACSEDIFGAHDCVNKNKDDDVTGADKEERHSKANLFICYHCDYRSPYRDSLKSHAVRHYGEKYKCDDRHGLRKLNCRKCIYEHILKSFDTCVKVCKKCQFKTLNNVDFDNHVSRNACSVWQAKAIATIDNAAYFFKCFDCGATYQKEQGLKNHAIRHIVSNFQCDDHIGDTDHNCPKCIYEDIVKSVESSTFTCGNCGFKAYTWLHLKGHESNKGSCQLYRDKLKAEGKSPTLSQIKTFRCFDCDFSHQRKEFLVKHIAAHARSTFQCVEHNEYAEDCAKCLYRDLLNKSRHWIQCFDCTPPLVFTTKFSLKRHILRSHRDSTFVCKKHDVKSEQCHKCQYECLVTQIIVQHQLACYDCNDKYFRTKELLKNHIKECHLRSEFVCKVHQLKKNPQSCDMCDYEKLVPICERETAPAQSVAGGSKGVGKYLQCFDCEFKTSARSELTKHIRKNHAESDFSCSEHTMGNIEEETCAMCRYECALVSFKAQFLNCSKCKFEAVNKDALDEHCKQNHSRVTFMKGAVASDAVVDVDDTASKDAHRKKLAKYPCLDCGSFVTDSEKNLLRHLSGSSHARYGVIEFNCKKHRVHDDTCERCVFEKLSKKARKK